MREELLSPLELLRKFCVSDYIERDTEKAVSCLSTDIHWFGTSDAEDVHNIYEASEYIKTEISKSPLPYHIELTEENENLISPGVGTATVKMRIVAEGLAIMSRVTAAAKLEDGCPKIFEMHTSIPEVSQQNGEYFPFEFLREHESEVVRGFVNDMMPGGIWGFYLEPGFPLSMINQAMLLSLGYKNEQEYRASIDGKAINAIHPEDRQILRAAISKGLTRGEDFQTLLRIKRNDGSYFWADSRGIRSRDSENRETLICLCLDAAEMAAAKGRTAEAAGPPSEEEKTPPPMEPKKTSDGLKQPAGNRWNILAMAVGVLAMIAAVVTFGFYLTEHQWKATASTIRTASLAGVECVSNAMHSDQFALSNAAKMIGQTDRKDMDGLLIQMGGASRFIEMIADFDQGGLYSSLGGTQTEIAAVMVQFQFSGQDDISKTYYGNTGKKQIAYRSDIISDGKKIGDLYGTVELSKYYVPNVMEFYSGKGFSYVIDAKSGDFIIYTTRTMSQGAYRDFYSALLETESRKKVSELKQVLQSGKTGSTIINMLGNKTYMYFVPMEKGSSRYLITMVPYEVMRTESVGMISIVVIFILAVLLAAALILIFNSRIAKTKMQEREYRNMILHLLSENVDSTFFIYDAKENSIDYISENAYRILGISQEDFMGKGFLERGLMPESDKRVKAAEALDKRCNFSLDYSFRNPVSGKQQLVRLSGYVPSEEDWRDKWVFCMDDRTDEVLRERRLELAVTEADEANTAKTEFLANMSHDIRTPMNGIIGMTQLALMEGVDKKTMRNYMEKVSNSSAFLLSLINDILDMSKIESGTIELNPKAYQMKELCVYLESVIGPLSREKQIELIFDLDQELCFAVDQQRFNQILFNLLSNAVKYTDRNGRVVLSIRGQELGGKMMHLTLCVEDNGSGMTPEFQKKMFMPFTQENRKIIGMNGTGLGLAIVKKLVDLMNGTIRVESNVGQGSRFIIELKVLRAEAAAKATKEECQETADFSLAGVHALLCEDNAINQEIMVSILETMEMEVDLAVDGKDGVDHYLGHESGYYKAVLMDCRMPVMDGYEATRAIRAMGRPDSETLPIIALTADAFEEDQKNCREAGMNDFLAKPVEIGELQKVLCRNIFGTGDRP